MKFWDTKFFISKEQNPCTIVASLVISFWIIFQLIFYLIIIFHLKFRGVVLILILIKLLDLLVLIYLKSQELQQGMGITLTSSFFGIIIHQTIQMLIYLKGQSQQGADITLTKSFFGIVVS